MCIKFSPGKAYVRGYDIEKTGIEVVDVPKTRTTQSISNVNVPFEMGNLVRINNITGAPKLKASVEFYNQRKQSATAGTGNKIGDARVYSFNLTDAAYTGDSTNWDLYLYDIQTYTILTLNSTLTTLYAPAFIEGKSSGASGYLVSNVSNSSELILYQVSGSFISNEQLKSNGEDLDRVVSSLTDYNLSDVHQIIANETTGIGTFTSDPLLSLQTLLSPFGTQFSISSGGVVKSGQENFYVGIKVGDVVSYTKQGDVVPTYNKVSAINTSGKTITITPTTSVSGICSGSLPASDISVNDFKKVSLEILNNQNAFLYSKLSDSNVSTVDLAGSEIIIRKSYQIPSSSFSSGSYSQILETDPNLTLLPFDEEDYNLVFANGDIESLTSSQVSVSGRTITLVGLSQNGAATLTATLKKNRLKPRKKIFNRAEVLNIVRSSNTSSGVGTTSLGDGLTYSSIHLYMEFRSRIKIII